MMNVIAISLVVASMAFATHANSQLRDQVIVKGGRRSVVVEYDDDDNSGQGNTKVSISPPLTVSSAAESVAGAAVGPDGRGAGEWICDAFGKCKHKISGAIFNAKNKVTETTEDVEEGAKEIADSAINKAKEAASKATQAAEEATGKAKQTASRAKQATEDSAETLKQKAKQTASRVEEAAEDSTKGLKQKGKAAVGKAGEAVEEKVESAKEEAEEKVESAKEEMSDMARRGKEALHEKTTWLIGSLISLVHLFGFATAYGTATWVTFTMSHLLARSLPRQQFGVVQSRVYPIYFKVMAVSVGLALMGHLFGRRHPKEVSGFGLARTLQAYNLAGSIMMVLVNLFYMEPRATKVMYERMKLEKEEGRGVHQTTRFVDQTGAAVTPLTTTTTAATTTTTTAQRREEGGEVKSKMERLTRRLRKMNSYSSLLNVMTLMGLTWHLVYLSQRLCL